MKIAHVQVVPHLSGAQQISLDILTDLQSDENELFIICGELHDFSVDFVESFKNINVNIIEVVSLKRELGRWDINAFIDLYKVFSYNNFDIIHTNSTKPAIIARIAARFANCKKIIHTVHGIAFHNHVFFLKRFIFYFAEIFSAFFGHKQVSVNKYYQKFYPLINTTTIYNGVDFSKFAVLKPNIISKKIHFSFFGRLDEQKNPLEFIEAIYLLHKDGLLNCNIEFSLAGNGELNFKCQQLIDLYELQDYIKMLGWISDKNSYLNSVDVLCQPSKWEAFGLVFVEAAYFGIPAIASHVEGIPEVVLDKKTGLLYKGGAEQLKECILHLIQNPHLIKKLGDQAKVRAITEFSKEKMVSSYRNIYLNE